MWCSTSPIVAIISSFIRHASIMYTLAIIMYVLCMYYYKYYVYTCNLSAVPAKPVLTSAATSSKLSLVEATLGRRSINTQLLYLFDLFSTFLFIYIYQISYTYVWIHGDRPLNIGPEWGISRIKEGFPSFQGPQTVCRYQAWIGFQSGAEWYVVHCVKHLHLLLITTLCVNCVQQRIL